ncbi:MAG: hypothetical protein WCT11_00800 [Candidatus Magasanikbacteria bacterium]|jgi:hypothetical protein
MTIIYQKLYSLTLYTIFIQDDGQWGELAMRETHGRAQDLGSPIAKICDDEQPAVLQFC